ncbi:zinc finger protein 503 isoform X1 [Cetorhinus maximus]|uniref:zinc finger protein 503 isoform X1 n=2 Tax=Carcharodon carcharias TaxID=13397 RepID=UPI001B7ED0F7|nr:zinc finger protein 503 isoform X1 [Carcharodon carcharias]
MKGSRGILCLKSCPIARESEYLLAGITATEISNNSSRGNSSSKPFYHTVPPSDPSRQANRLPIKVLKMLTARTGHILHPEYLQPLPSTPVSPIELDAKKSPLALLAQTCSQIGKPDPPPSSKLTSVTSNGTSDKDSGKPAPLKLSDIGVEDKSSFKPYSKHTEKKDSSSSGSSSVSGEKSGFRVPSATCQPFTPRTGSPNSSTSSPMPSEGKGSDSQEKKDIDTVKNSSTDNSTTTSVSHNRISVSCAGINVEVNQHQETSVSKPIISETSALSSGLVAPVSPYKPGQTVFPLPPASMTYPGTLGAYAGYPHQFVPHGVSLDHAKSSLVGAAQLASSLGCGLSSKSTGSSPLAGASPPSMMTASLCRDPYCLSYHCAAHLAGAANNSCTHDPTALKSGYPLVYPSHPLHAVHTSMSSNAGTPTLAGHHLYPYGFMLPNDPQPHVCNWVSANGPCDKRFCTSEELLNHLRTHTAFSGTDKLMAGYQNSSLGSAAAAAAAAAVACHMHLPPTGAPGSPGGLTLRSPHALGLSSRYHPYTKSPLPTHGAPGPVTTLPVPATGHYYSPYALYGQRLTTASALGYQ